MKGNSPTAYIKEFEGFAEMLARYPIKANIAAFQLGINEHGTTMMDICLEPGRLAKGAAELIEWHQTLDGPETMIERAPNGDTVNIAVLGRNSENDTKIHVWLCTVKYEPRARTLLAAEGLDPKPGTKQLFDSQLLHLWAIDV